MEEKIILINSQDTDLIPQYNKEGWEVKQISAVSVSTSHLARCFVWLRRCKVTAE